MTKRATNNGEWDTQPALTAARRSFIAALGKRHTQSPLGDAASFLNGTSYDVEQVSETGKNPMIRISNISDPSSAYLKTNEQLRPQFWVEPGDLLVSWSASFKSCIWNGPSGFLNQHIFKVVEKKGFNRSYIRHAIEASFDQMQQHVVGIGMMHLRRGDFLSHEIPAPPIEVQNAVAAYLDWIEQGGIGKEPSLPSELDGTKHDVSLIDTLSKKIQQVWTLHQETSAEVEALIVGVHLQLAGSRTRKLGDVLTLDERKVQVLAGEEYPQVGVRGFGGGLFRKNSILAEETTYRTFNQLYDGALILSQVKGWEGAIGVASADLAGWFVSPEYRTFRCIPSEARATYLAILVKTEWFWRQLKNLTRGVGARRERTRPEHFLELEVPMPDVMRQEDGERLFARVEGLKGRQEEIARELSALLPSILDKTAHGKR